MITRVTDYQFVVGRDIDAEHPHGDMDRVIVNGGIMPLRTGVSETTGVSNQRILRGEDVMFLSEALIERLNLSQRTNVSPLEMTFCRRPSVTMRWFLYNMTGNVSGVFYDAMPSVQYDVSQDFWTQFDSLHGYTDSSITISSGAFDIGHKMAFSDMLAAFADIKKFSIVKSRRDVSTASYTAYHETGSLDSDYPYNIGSCTGTGYFRAYGGQNLGDDHPNAYGGYEFWWSSATYNQLSSYVTIETAPSNIKTFDLQRFQYTSYDGVNPSVTTNKYEVNQFESCDIVNGLVECSESASKNKSLVTNGLMRYFGITPGSIVTTAGASVEVDVRPILTNRIFSVPGNHTKWW